MLEACGKKRNCFPKFGSIMVKNFVNVLLSKIARIHIAMKSNNSKALYWWSNKKKTPLLRPRSVKRHTFLTISLCSSINFFLYMLLIFHANTKPYCEWNIQQNHLIKSYLRHKSRYSEFHPTQLIK